MTCDITARRNHSWSVPDREVWATYRTCLRCGLVKITRHDDYEEFPWTEFVRNGVLVDEARGRTPKCEAVEQREKAEAAGR